MGFIDNAVLIFYGQDDKGEVLEGSELARQLRQRIHQDDGLLQFPIVSVDTVLCLDHCSGHGVCQDTPAGRECLCNAFWMENFLKRRYGSGERNCGEKNKLFQRKLRKIVSLWFLSIIFFKFLTIRLE